jgi:hypothetical protein
MIGIPRVSVIVDSELRGGDETVFFLLEHKSWRDEGLLRQLHRYVTHVVTESQQGRTTVPHVVPVVVHHGMRKFVAAWSAPRKPDPHPVARPSLTQYQPRLQFVLDDLMVSTEADIMARPVSPMARLTLLCLRFLAKMTDEAALAALERWSSVIRAVDASRGARLCLGALCSYGLHVTNLSGERLTATVARFVSKPNRDFVMSTADKLRAEGRVEGRAQGRVEGLAKGRVEVILRQLTARFGPLPAKLTSRVRSASSAALDRWALRILDASSLDEVFAEK